jgi:TPR repeat protein
MSKSKYTLSKNLWILWFLCYVLGLATNGFGEDSTNVSELNLDGLRSAAEQGYAKPQNQLGLMYRNGMGVEQDANLAVRWFAKAAEQGYEMAQYHLGRMYYSGQGVEQDHQIAFHWYAKAAEQGNAGAQYNVGQMYYSGEGVELDHQLAVKWFAKAAEQGNAGAQNFLGWIHDTGEGVDQDHQLAFHWYAKAAEQGNAGAQYNLGWMYHIGKGVEQDHQIAFHWYAMAAEQGNAGARYNLGQMYYSGEGVQQDHQIAFHWYAMAAEQGNAGAQYNVGWMYYSGEGVEQDLEVGAQWYAKAAEQGNAGAQYSLGQMYTNGKGVEQDYQLAVHWYVKSAEQGNADAQNTLGRMYCSGEGVEQDLEVGAQWYAKAAEQEFDVAQNNLGRMYHNGVGVEQNYELAVKWFTKAAEQENADAQNNLGRMYYSGEGVEQDLEVGAQWYAKAAEQGDVVADFALRRISALDRGFQAPSELKVLRQMKLAYAAGRLESGTRVAEILLETSSEFFNPKEAWKILDQITQTGISDSAYFSDALVLLIRMHAEGLHVKKDPDKAMALAKQFLDTGDTNNTKFAEHLEYLIQIAGKNGERDNEPIVFELIDTFCSSDTDLISFIENDFWILLQRRDSSSSNLVTRCFDQQVERRLSLEAYERVAYLYKTGIPGFVDANHLKAFEYMSVAANSQKPNPSAMNWLGLFYDGGFGTERNDSKALHWYRKAAEIGDASATNNLGWTYEKGHLGVKQSYEKAIEYYQQAISSDPDEFFAYTNLGRLYESGLGVEQDDVMARIYFKEAFNLGDIEAGNHLARFLSEGVGGKGDKSAAIKILEEVAKGSTEYALKKDIETHDAQTQKAREMLAALRPKLEESPELNFGNYHALIIGNSDYAFLNDLKTAANDAQQVARILENAYGFNVKLLLDASRRDIKKTLNGFRKTLTLNDNFLIYYAGHGVLDEETEEGYWQPVDSESDDNSQWIPTSNITKDLKAFKSNNILVIADSCYAASVFRGLKILSDDNHNQSPAIDEDSALLKRLISSRTRVAMTSGGMAPVPDQLGLSRNSVFAGSFVAMLQSNNTVITSEDLFRGVRKKVVPITAEAGFEQTPEYSPLHLSGHDGGDFVFRRLSP